MDRENPRGKRRKITLAKVKVEPGLENVKSETEKCSICWSDPPVNAIQLECKHMFCFLCIKSVATVTNLCPLCRSEVDLDFDHGQFKLVGNPKLPAPCDDGTFWFYQGKTGWWLYDADTNKDLENASKEGKKKIEKLIAGQVYVISLTKLKQYRKDEPSRIRRICRNTVGFDRILGVAGLRNGSLSQLPTVAQPPYVQAPVSSSSDDFRF